MSSCSRPNGEAYLAILAAYPEAASGTRSMGEITVEAGHFLVEDATPSREFA